MSFSRQSREFSDKDKIFLKNNFLISNFQIPMSNQAPSQNVKKHGVIKKWFGNLDFGFYWKLVIGNLTFDQS
ncbi:MAG: hypothetical protein PHD72_02455 [Patescibacteria group bacterium]|nr:hypothetical protein [Patescibacteria group bacterium]